MTVHSAKVNAIRNDEIMNEQKKALPITRTKIENILTLNGQIIQIYTFHTTTDRFSHGKNLSEELGSMN